MVIIDNIDDERIKLYKSLRYTPKEHIENNLFIAEGEISVLKLIHSNLKIHSILCNQEFYNLNKKIIFQRITNDNVLISDKNLLNQIVGFNLHSGIMLLAYQPENAKINELGNQIICLNGIVDAENVGSIVRNASAFNFSSLIYDSKSSSPYLRRAVRVGMGNIIDLKTFKAENLFSTLQNLKNNNYKIVSAEINDISKPLTDYKFDEKFVLIFGSEGHGIDDEILSISDDIIHIPIQKKVSSINVSVSSAIFMYEIRKYYN